MKVNLTAALGQVGEPLHASGWSVDSRGLAPGDVFYALEGPSHNGHDYVSEAARKGAAACVVSREVDVATRVYRVADTLKALQQTAVRAREWWDGDVVAVTGSAGKTSAKDAIAQMLGSEFRTGKTTGNLNNHVGVPLSILRLPDECHVAVLEMGMNHAGEIRELARIARPRVGVVTNVGHAHVEFFESIEGVALAKRELIEELPSGGVAVLNADDPRVSRFRDVHAGPSVSFGFSEEATVRGTDLELSAGASRFRVDGVCFETRLAGRHNVMNVLAAIAVGRVFGVDLERLCEAARSLEPTSMRGEQLAHRGITIWNDCYNSNPGAAKAMLDLLRETPARRRIAVLGEMLELGREAERLHREVGRYVSGQGTDIVVGIRGAARWLVEEARGAGMSGEAYYFDTPEAAGDFVRQMAREGDAVLFKGSRGVRVELALERLLRE